MKEKITGLHQSIDKKLRTYSEKIPPQKRKIIVFISCLLFMAFFIFTLLDAFRAMNVKEMIKIEHITPLDLPEDTIIQKFKDFKNGK